jgi:tRNA (cmo5U34)-methyltransferase
MASSEAQKSTPEGHNPPQAQGASKEPVDQIFARKLAKIPPFTFDQKVAEVFSDMAQRSIPYYNMVQDMVVEMALDWYQPGTKIYDLGCATGRTLVLIAKALEQKGVRGQLVGVDNSQDMLDKAQENLDRLEVRGVELLRDDLESVDLSGASVIIMNYTLQFVSPLNREPVIQRIYQHLSHHGALLVSEKTRQNDTNISRFFGSAYYDFKRAQGYSEMEISQKREALENVLIPYSRSEIEALFRTSGFEEVEPFFTWFNFSSFLCVKSGPGPGSTTPINQGGLAR